MKIRNFAAVLLICLSPSAFAATLLVSGGELLGATGVNVNGTLYNVQFVDGTCVDLFSGCDVVADFDFTSPLDAMDAAGALFDQVIFDGPAGDFDSSPELTRGCADTDGCITYIPYAIGGGTSITAVLLSNARDNGSGRGPFELADFFGPLFSIDRGSDLSTDIAANYAVFSSVPVPGALVLLASALAAAGALGLRARIG